MNQQLKFYRCETCNLHFRKHNALMKHKRFPCNVPLTPISFKPKEISTPINKLQSKNEKQIITSTAPVSSKPTAKPSGSRSRSKEAPTEAGQEHSKHAQSFTIEYETVSKKREKILNEAIVAAEKVRSCLSEVANATLEMESSFKNVREILDCSMISAETSILTFKRDISRISHEVDAISEVEKASGKASIAVETLETAVKEQGHFLQAATEIITKEREAFDKAFKYAKDAIKKF